MTQLILSRLDLREIGFKKTIIPARDEMNPEKTIYEIECINACFYYNCGEDVHRWYYETKIENKSNSIHLDIQSLPTLFTVLDAFRVKYNIIMI